MDPWSAVWNLKLPEPLDQLVNNYEKRQIGLCSLFSTTVRNVTPTQARHMQGQVFTGHRLDSHYYGLLVFLAVSEEDFISNSKKPETDSSASTEVGAGEQCPVQRFLCTHQDPVQVPTTLSAA